MARPNPIRTMMQAPLPSLTEQRRKLYRPTHDEIIYTYNVLNRYIFDNELKRPPITVGQFRGYWGECSGHDEMTNPGTYCTMKISDKWFCVQWMVTTVAHEMAHQYEWDVVGEYYESRGEDRRMTHRSAFFIHRARMAEYGINLKTAHRMKKWFKYQDFTKC